MRVGDGHLAAQLGIAKHAEGGERPGLDPQGQRRLGEGDGLAAEVEHIDVAIVSEIGREDRRDAAKQCAAGVGRKLPIADLAGLLRGRERIAAQEAIGVGRVTAFEGKAMQHRQAVEPMIVGAVSHLELGGAGAEQGACKPGRQLALDDERHRRGRLAGQRAEALAIGKRSLAHRRILCFVA